MIFLVENAAGGGHPLDVAGTDDPAVARRILMLDLAVIDDGDRLEPAMRMLADAAPLGCRREIMRPRIVEQQEGADVPIQRVIGKERADRETIAHPMAAFVAVAAEDRLVHRSSPDRATPQWGALDLEGTWTCIAEDERLRLRTQRPINGTMQDLNDLHYFVRVVDHGGFAPAARATGLQKSKLSRRIAALESRLGVRLLNRSSRR